MKSDVQTRIVATFLIKTSQKRSDTVKVVTGWKLSVSPVARRLSVRSTTFKLKLSSRVLVFFSALELVVQCWPVFMNSDDCLEMIVLGLSWHLSPSVVWSKCDYWDICTTYLQNFVCARLLGVKYHQWLRNIYEHCLNLEGGIIFHWAKVTIQNEFYCQCRWIYFMHDYDDALNESLSCWDSNVYKINGLFTGIEDTRFNHMIFRLSFCGRKARGSSKLLLFPSTNGNTLVLTEKVNSCSIEVYCIFTHT